MNRFKSILNSFKNIRTLDVKDIDKVDNRLDRPSEEYNSSNSNLSTLPVIIHSDNWTQNQLLQLAASGRYQTFLNTSSKIIESELISCLKVHTDPKGFLKNPIPFWFDKGATSLILPFEKKSDKFELIRQIEPFLSLTESRLVQENARLLFQELFMNAVLDAPKEARKKGIKIKDKAGELILAHDHEKFVISIFDPYGALDPHSLVFRICKILQSENTSIINFDRRRGGAGIGSSLLYRYSSTLSIVVERGKGTRVSCTIPLKMSQKKFDLLEKNLQFINIQSEGDVYEKQRNA